MSVKTCKKCGKSKPISDFYKAKGCIDGTRHSCKECLIYLSGLSQSTRTDQRKTYMDEYRSKNPQKWKRSREQQDKVNERRRLKYKENPEYRESQKTAAKEYYANNPIVRKNQRLRKYNITADDFEKMMQRQDGKCAICGYSNTDNMNYFPVIDHCHTHKHIRGILCMNCNMGLGKFKDDPQLLLNAINYLEVYRNGAMDNLV